METLDLLITPNTRPVVATLSDLALIVVTLAPLPKILVLEEGERRWLTR
jgi:hypothetical protein